jgi:hypothetical protein
MDPVLLAFIFAIPAAYIAGVLTHKYVISEADSIKSHVTAAEGRIRTDIASLLKKADSEVASVASKAAGAAAKI